MKIFALLAAVVAALTLAFAVASLDAATATATGTYEIQWMSSPDFNAAFGTGDTGVRLWWGDWLSYRGQFDPQTGYLCLDTGTNSADDAVKDYESDATLKYLVPGAGVMGTADQPGQYYWRIGQPEFWYDADLVIIDWSGNDSPNNPPR